jgi:hypothetical protein
LHCLRVCSWLSNSTAFIICRYVCVSDATISSYSLCTPKAFFCMTIILLLYILKKYYLNESVTVLWVCKYILPSQNDVKPFSFFWGGGGVYSWGTGGGEMEKYVLPGRVSEYLLQR